MLPSTHLSLFEFARDPSTKDSAWARIVELYGPVIQAWVRRRTRQTADAEDVAQAVLLRLLNSLASFDPNKGRFRSWLQTVVHNVAADYARSSRARLGQIAQGGDAFQAMLDCLADPESIADLDSALVERHRVDPLMAAALDAVRASATPSAWKAFERLTGSNASARDVAAELGMSVGAAYQAKYRLRELVKAAYGRLLTETAHGTSGE